MAHEIFYTSAPEGIRPGSGGFGTVAASAAIPKPLWDRLEALSIYRHEFQIGQSGSNPSAQAHWTLAWGGHQYHVLSRISDAGLDHTQRTNFFAHHLAMEASELPPGGPAWLLSLPGLLQARWNGHLGVLEKSAIPQQDPPAGPCHQWQRLTGDAGWGGALADAMLRANQPIGILFAPGLELLPLIQESLALLTPAQRWQVTFNTYFTSLPGSATCRCRCALAGTPAAEQLIRWAASGILLNLTNPQHLGNIPASDRVTHARTGIAPQAASPRSASPTPTPSKIAPPVPLDPLELVPDDEPQTMAINRNPSRRPSGFLQKETPPPQSKGWILWGLLAGGVVLLGFWGIRGLFRGIEPPPALPLVVEPVQPPQAPPKVMEVPKPAPIPPPKVAASEPAETPEPTPLPPPKPVEKIFPPIELPDSLPAISTSGLMETPRPWALPGLPGSSIEWLWPGELTAPALRWNEHQGVVKFQPLSKGMRHGLAVEFVETGAEPLELAQLFWDPTGEKLEFLWRRGSLLKAPSLANELYWYLANSRVKFLKGPELRWRQPTRPPLDLAAPSTDLSWPAEWPLSTQIEAPALPAGWEVQSTPAQPDAAKADPGRYILFFSHPTQTPGKVAWFTLQFPPDMSRVESNWAARLAQEQQDLKKCQDRQGVVAGKIQQLSPSSRVGTETPRSPQFQQELAALMDEEKRTKLALAALQESLAAYQKIKEPLVLELKIAPGWSAAKLRLVP